MIIAFLGFLFGCGLIVLGVSPLVVFFLALAMLFFGRAADGR